MSITINSNILSLNAQRRLGQHTNDLRSSFEKLSSGLRVSKASDDAAGLSISENLKIDTKLSSQALRNVNDGISMISIISGALDSQKSILFRMSELAEQSANGVNSSKQRDALQQEYMSLQEEFDRVASSAKFNGISLLRNANANTISLMAGITGADSSLLSVAAANSHRFTGITAYRGDLADTNGVFGASDNNELRKYIANPDNYNGPVTNDVQNQGILTSVDSTGTIVDISFYLRDAGSTASPNPVIVVSGLSKGGGTIFSFQAGSSNNVVTFTQVSDSSTVTVNFDFSDTIAELSEIEPESRKSAIGFTNIKSRVASKDSLDTVRNKIEDLSKLQGSFGAIESRLTFAANKLQVDRENFQSAASQITDVDVATESSNLTKTQILQQAAVSVLAQANQQPQIALQLLGSFRR